MNSQEISQAWLDVCTHIKSFSDVSVGSFEAFASRLQPQAMSSNYLMLTADTIWIQEWVKKNYRDIIIRALNEMYGTSFTVDIEYDPSQAPQPVIQQPSYEAIPAAKPTPSPAPIIETKQESKTETPKQQPDEISQKERFDNFVTGDSNILAYEYALNVARMPGKTRANPLFIWGKSGLGKTHLLRAIKNEILETIPDYHVEYTDIMDLVSELSSASIERDFNRQSYKEFDKKYRTADVLLIDDLQQIGFGRKSETVNNVFSFINSLLSQGKQVVLAADRAPGSIDLEQRYTSRFGSGVVQVIDTPSIETKLAIIKQDIEEYQEETGSSFNLPAEVQMYLAENSSSNIRELKGIISTLIFSLSYDKNISWENITVDQVDGLLRDSFYRMRQRITANDVQREVAEFYKISQNDLVSAKRSRPIAHARQVAIYLCDKILTTHLTLSEIGKVFGGRDHSTIMYSISTIQTQIKENRELKEELEILEQIIREA